MANEQLYLRPDFATEPLVAQWYAWAGLISPSTACLNIKNRHMPIIKSYIADPLVHKKAREDPSMTGGPFSDLGGEKAGEIKRLLAAAVREQAHLISFRAHCTHCCG